MAADLHMNTCTLNIAAIPTKRLKEVSPEVGFCNKPTYTPDQLLVTCHQVPFWLDRLICLPGYYGPGGAALNISNSLCIPCSTGSTTISSGSSDPSDCSEWRLPESLQPAEWTVMPDLCSYSSVL